MSMRLNWQYELEFSLLKVSQYGAIKGKQKQNRMHQWPQIFMLTSQALKKCFAQSSSAYYDI